ncbi:MAG: O-antigen ligase family protein [Firmicutes bacterium]|nr:O-antigen ligase family protein [Bacillota bacterium]
MTNIIKGSCVCRVILWIISAFRSNWQKGILGRISAGWNRHFATSVTRRFCIAYCEFPEYVQTSRYAKVLRGIRGIFERIGDVLRQSVFYKVVSALWAFWFWLTKGSVVGKLINKLHARQWLLLAFTMYLPIEYMIRDTLKISSLASVWEELFLVLAVFLVLWRRALKKAENLDRETPLDAYILLFMAVGLLLMSLVNPWPAIAFAGYRIVMEYILWFFIIIRLIEDDKDMKVMYAGFMIMAGLIALHGCYQYVIGVEIPSSWTTKTEAGVRTRVFSLTGSPNILGSLMVMTTPMMAALVYFFKKKIFKFGAFLMTGAMCLCLLFTFSRGAWGGMVIAVVIFALIIDRRIIGLLGLGIAAILIAVPSITSRLTFLFTPEYAEASAAGGRTLRWETGRALLADSNPWLGFGLGRFGGAVAMDNQVLDETDEFQYFYMDNYYLKTLVEMGYLGMIFFILMLVVFLIWGLRAIFRSDLSFMANPGDTLVKAQGNYRVLSAGIFSGMCGVLVHCYFENIFEEPYMTSYFWGLAALLMYMGLFRPKDRAKKGLF